MDIVFILLIKAFCGNNFRCLKAVDSFSSMPQKMHGIHLFYRLSEKVDLPASQIISLKEKVKDRLLTEFGEYDSVKVRVRVIFSSFRLSFKSLLCNQIYNFILLLGSLSALVLSLFISYSSSFPVTMTNLFKKISPYSLASHFKF